MTPYNVKKAAFGRLLSTTTIAVQPVSLGAEWRLCFCVRFMDLPVMQPHIDKRVVRTAVCCFSLV
eukprot:35967-Eustigmatos_ZCMA.PRE.1